MRKRLTLIFALLFVASGLLFTASCAKKMVKSDEPTMVSAEGTLSPRRTEPRPFESDKLARQRAIEEERLRQERLLKEQEEERQTREAQVVTRTPMAERRNIMVEDVYFSYDSAVLSPSAQDILTRKAEWLRSNPHISVTIEGHCDERGTNEYNLALGDRRAESVKAFLVRLGLSPSRLMTISYGEERPLDPGHNEYAWSKNRRAHFVVE